MLCPLPRLGVLPGNVSGVVKVKQKAFTAIEEPESNEVVVYKRQHRAYDDVHHTKTPVTVGYSQLRAQRGVTVHVFEVIRQGRVRIMDQGTLEVADCTASSQFVTIVRIMSRRKSFSSTEKPQLWVRVEASKPDPTPKEEVLAWHPIAV